MDIPKASLALQSFLSISTLDNDPLNISSAEVQQALESGEKTPDITLLSNLSAIVFAGFRDDATHTPQNARNYNFGQFLEDLSTFDTAGEQNCFAREAKLYEAFQLAANGDGGPMLLTRQEAQQAAGVLFPYISHAALEKADDGITLREFASQVDRLATPNPSQTGLYEWMNTRIARNKLPDTTRVPGKLQPLFQRMAEEPLGLGAASLKALENFEAFGYGTVQIKTGAPSLKWDKTKKILTLQVPENPNKAQLQASLENMGRVFYALQVAAETGSPDFEQHSQAEVYLTRLMARLMTEPVSNWQQSSHAVLLDIYTRPEFMKLPWMGSPVLDRVEAHKNVAGALTKLLSTNYQTIQNGLLNPRAQGEQPALNIEQLLTFGQGATQGNQPNTLGDWRVLRMLQSNMGLDERAIGLSFEEVDRLFCQYTGRSSHEALPENLEQAFLDIAGQNNEVQTPLGGLSMPRITTGDLDKAMQRANNRPPFVNSQVILGP